jgi:hypothetical protein
MELWLMEKFNARSVLDGWREVQPGTLRVSEDGTAIHGRLITFDGDKFWMENAISNGPIAAFDDEVSQRHDIVFEADSSSFTLNVAAGHRAVTHDDTAVRFEKM